MKNNTQFAYLIVAPDFRDSSMGIQVLHRLCHLINERGGYARMVGCSTNPDWNTPALTKGEYESLTSSGHAWAAIYPEVVTGNPLNAPVCVRYMLNREGVINKNKINEDPEDIFVWYREEFADKEPDPNILGIDCFDLDLFKDDNPNKDLDILYVNRVPASAIDFSTLPPNLTILSMENPLSLQELASLLKRARILYSFESSGTCLLAMLCGCPVVALYADGYEYYAMNEQTLVDIGGYGFTFSNTPEAIAEVKDNLPKVRDYLLLKRQKVEEQLDKLLLQINNKIIEKTVSMNLSGFRQWVDNRGVSVEHLSFLEKSVYQSRLLHVIINRQNSVDAVKLTLASLVPQLRSESIVLLVNSSETFSGSNCRFITATQENWIGDVYRLAEENAFDWLHCVDAGVQYTVNAIDVMHSAFASAGNCQALYTDEALLHSNHSLSSIFKTDFNLDLFLSAPHLYMKRVFFQRDVLKEQSGFELNYQHSFEFDWLAKIIFQWDISSVGHVPEVVTILSDETFAQSSPEEEKAIINDYLARRGFFDAAPLYQDGGWHINYQYDKNATVSVLLDCENDSELLERCLNSLIFNTDLAFKEIFVAVTGDVHDDFVQVIEKYRSCANIDAFSFSVNVCYASRMNQLASNASGEFYLMLDCHTIFVLKSWLGTLLAHMRRPEVGCVGPKIIDMEKRLLSAGVIAGAGNSFAYVGQGESWLEAGYLSRYLQVQNYSALSGHCLLMKKEVLDAINNINIDYNKIPNFDIAFSLLSHSLGYLSVWTPYSVVVSDSRDFVINERQITSDEIDFIFNFSGVFANDSAYNSNLSLRTPLFNFDHIQKPVLETPTKAGVETLLLIHYGPNDDYVYRLRDLANRLSELEAIQLYESKMTPTIPELMRINPAAIIFTGLPAQAEIDFLIMAQQKLAFRLSALMRPASEVKSAIMPEYKVDKRLTFSPELMKQLCKKKIAAEYIPSFLTENWFSHISNNKGPGFRLLCIPSDWSQNEKDFMQKVISATCSYVDWIILGPWPVEWIPFVKETVRLHNNEITPEQLCKLEVNAAVIFRDKSESNRLKDAWLLIQLAACGIYTVVSDVSTIHCDLPMQRVIADPEQWRLLIEQLATHGVRDDVSGISLSNKAHALYSFDALDAAQTVAHLCG